MMVAYMMNHAVTQVTMMTRVTMVIWVARLLLWLYPVTLWFSVGHNHGRTGYNLMMTRMS